MKPKPIKQVNHSIRLDSKVYQELVKEATSRSISFNNLVSRVLQRHTEFDRFVPDLKFMLFHKGLVRNGLEGASDELAISSGKLVGGEFARDVLLTMGLPLNRDSLIYFIDTILGEYTNFADCQRRSKDGKELFYLRHDLGPKWSLFLKGCVLAAFKSVINEEVEIESTEDGITFAA